MFRQLLGCLGWACQGDRVDGISALPDDVLLQLLARLGCAREVVRTSVLSSRWRGLWTRVPELAFRSVDPDTIEAVLAQLVHPKLHSLVIEVGLASEEAARRGSSLLRAAAQLEPETFSATLHCYVEGAASSDDSYSDNDLLGPPLSSIELPCFDCAESLVLNAHRVTLTPPPTGMFSRLRSLCLASCNTDPGALLLLCPCLRILELHVVLALKVVTVHSATLEELLLSNTYMSCVSRIDIDAPELKKVMLNVNMAPKFSVSFSAHKVEEVDWDLMCEWQNVGLPLMRFFQLSYRVNHGVRTLWLDTSSSIFHPPVATRSFVLEIEQLPSSDFSVLDLEHKTFGHSFGPSLLHLLRIRPLISKLKLTLDDGEEESCPPNCPCRQPDSWRTENISLMNLEEVYIFYHRGFRVGNDGADFLKLLFRSAPMLRRMEVGVSGMGYDEIYSICEEYPHVECVVRRCTDC